MKSFNFANNGLTNVVCNDLAEMIARNANIEEILLSQNKMQCKEISCLLNVMCNYSFCLKRLEIGKNNVLTDSGTEKLMRLLTKQCKLEKLSISFCRFQIPSACKLIKNLFNAGSLTEVDCGYCNFSLCAIRNFQGIHLHNTSLEVLLLPGNNLMAEGVIILCNLLRYVETLKHLNLGSNNITDAAAYQLAKLFNICVTLQSIELCSNHLGSTGFMTLAKSPVQMSCLRVINFESNKIHSSAVDDIACVITHNPCLEEVTFGDNKLETSGAIKVFET